MNRPNEVKFYVETIEDKKVTVTYETTDPALVMERFADNLKGKYILGYAGMGKVTRTNHYNGFAEYVFYMTDCGGTRTRKYRYHFIVKEH